MGRITKERAFTILASALGVLAPAAFHLLTNPAEKPIPAVAEAADFTYAPRLSENLPDWCLTDQDLYRNTGWSEYKAIVNSIKDKFDIDSIFAAFKNRIIQEETDFGMSLWWLALQNVTFNTVGEIEVENEGEPTTQDSPEGSYLSSVFWATPECIQFVLPENGVTILELETVDGKKYQLMAIGDTANSPVNNRFGHFTWNGRGPANNRVIVVDDRLVPGQLLVQVNGVGKPRSARVLSVGSAIGLAPDGGVSLTPWLFSYVAQINLGFMLDIFPKEYTLPPTQ